MRAKLPNQIRLSGIKGDSTIGLIDDPQISPKGLAVHNIVFIPMASQIGTTTLVQRLCGADPKDPSPSSGINGYRGVWSITLDKSGSINYRSLFLWDVSYSTVCESRDMVDMYVQTAHVVVLLIPKTARSLIQNVQNWFKTLNASRVIVIITQSDKIGESQITPNDIEILSSSIAKAVVESSISSPVDNIANIIHSNIP